MKLEEKAVWCSEEEETGRVEDEGFIGVA